MLRADQNAQVAADTFSPVQERLPVLIQAERLMPSIHAGDHAAPASDAFLSLDSWEHNGVPFQHIRCGA